MVHNLVGFNWNVVRLGLSQNGSDRRRPGLGTILKNVRIKAEIKDSSAKRVLKFMEMKRSKRRLRQRPTLGPTTRV
jgi:hypothetical protein